MAQIGRKSETWGSRAGFLLASVGASVGLGNFWRFPYLTGEHGGSAFIFIYLGCVIFCCLPLLMAEYAMGRKSGMSAVEGIQSLARAEGKSKYWGIVAWVGTLAAFLILTFYMIISAWLLSFIPQSLSGAFENVDADAARANFEATTQNKPLILALFALLIAANVAVVARGVKGGLERSNKILMPMFCLALIGLLGFALTNGNSAAAADFLLRPDFSKVTFATVLAALGQAFFSVGVGIGVMMTYGAYLPQDAKVPRSAFIVATSDTLVAILACFAIFPIVFAVGLSPAQGHSLFFVTLPIAFGQMPGGAFFGPVFFTLALFAAFASSISLMEVGVSWLEEREGVNRFGASLGLGFVLFMFGAGYVFSSDYIRFVEFVTGSVMLPLGGFLIAIFAGWMLSREMLVSEFGDGRLMNVWRFMVRWVVPPLVGLILVLGSVSLARSHGLL
jgi:NSS family neurotransmitter:Na+ symporter